MLGGYAVVVLVVITGGPASGKTTLVEAFAARGYATVPEAAIQVIAELNEELGLEEQKAWRLANRRAFQLRVLARQVELEGRALEMSAGRVVFLDRCRIDGLAYCRHFDEPAPEELVASVGEVHYDRVFLLDTLPVVEDRSATGRTSDRAASLAIRATIEEVYVELGYEPIRVPVAPVEERLDGIAEALGLPKT